MINENIQLKTKIEIARIRKTGAIVKKIFDQLRDFIKPGITTKEIDTFCGRIIKKYNALSGIKGYKGFPGYVCTSVNEVAVHGIPGYYILREGDCITIDIVIEQDGWFADGAWTYLVGDKIPDEVKNLTMAAKEALRAGINAAVPGNYIGDIGNAIQRVADFYGYYIIEEFVGHGIGRSMHEDPSIPHVGFPGSRTPIVPGMVLCIEPVLCTGKPEYYLHNDGWSMIMKQGGTKTAQFEHTIAVTSKETQVLTE